jgi:hypothetical protein
MFVYVCVGLHLVKANHDRHRHHDESGCFAYCNPSIFKQPFYQIFKF